MKSPRSLPMMAADAETDQLWMKHFSESYSAALVNRKE